MPAAVSTNGSRGSDFQVVPEIPVVLSMTKTRSMPPQEMANARAKYVSTG